MPFRTVTNLDRYAFTRDGRRVEVLRGQRINLTDPEAARFDALGAGTTSTGTEPLAPASSIRGIDTLGAENLAPLSAHERAIREGRAYLTGTGRVALAVAGNVRATVTNPANSGRRVVVARLGAFVTATAFIDVLRNPATGLPAAAVRPKTNHLLADATTAAQLPAGVAELRVDTDTTTPLGGGTPTGLVLGLGTARRTDLTIGLILWPGEVLGFAAPFSGAADLTSSIYLYDEAL